MLIKDINFFDRYKEVQRREKNVSKAAAIQVVVIAGIVIATIVTTSVVKLNQLDLQTEVDRINAFITSPEVQARVAEIERKQQQLATVTGYHDAIALANHKYATIIQPDKVMVSSITALLPAATTIESFSYSNGTISLECKSDSEDKIAQYVHKLKAMETVHQVSYMGFSKAENDYTSSITITLLPGGIEDEAHE